MDGYVDTNLVAVGICISAKAGTYGEGEDVIVIPESGTYIWVITADESDKVTAQLRLPNAPTKVFEIGEGYDFNNAVFMTLTMENEVTLVKVSDEIIHPYDAADYLRSASLMGMEIPRDILMYGVLTEDFVTDYMGTFVSGRAGTYMESDDGTAITIPEDGTYVMFLGEGVTGKLKFYEPRLPRGIRMFCPPAKNSNAVFATVDGEDRLIKVDSEVYTAEDLALVIIEKLGVPWFGIPFADAFTQIDDGFFNADFVTARAGTYTYGSNTVVVPEDGTYLGTSFNSSGYQLVLPNAVPRKNEYGFYYHKQYNAVLITDSMMIHYSLVATENDFLMYLKLAELSALSWVSQESKEEARTLIYGDGYIVFGTDTLLVTPTGLAIGLALGGEGIYIPAKLHSASGSPWNFLPEPPVDDYIPPSIDDAVIPTVRHTITFVDWDGTVISERTYFDGAPIEVPQNPTRESDGNTHYVFRGWSPEVVPNAIENATYTAVYEETTSTIFTITFLDWDDSVIEARQLIEGEVINLPTNPTRPDDDDYRYTFSNWEPTVPATATADGSYKAVYTATPCYLIQFVDWDGSVISSQRYVQDSVIVVPENPTRASDGVYDYEFDKWTPDVFGVAIAHATYTATYKSTLIPVFYDVIFKDWDGTVISSVNYAAGDTVKIPADPVRESDGIYTYAFSGWDKPVSTVASANVTYTATYTATEIPVYYDIKFVDWNGTIISNTPTLKNTNITVPPDPVRESDGVYVYTFTGWNPEVKTKATANAEYLATYSAERLYNDVSEIFINTSEFTTLRDNSKNDDTTETLTGVSWFTYDGKTCNSIYTSGNHWFGFGANAEHLKINRRDGSVYYIYREEGTLYRYYKFLRFRMSGYTVHNTTGSSYLITYDVILWDTGDISLHMVDVPTSNYDGIFTLGSQTYTAPTISAPDVTFYLQEDGTYNIVYEPIFLELPFDKKYLVKIYDDAGYTLYTVTDGALVALETKDVVGATFAEFGCDELPSGDLLKSYGHFELLHWFGHENYYPEVRVGVVGIPYPQTVESRDYDMSHGTIHGIEKVLVEATEDVSFAMSIDSGASWMCFKDGVWVALSEGDSGMSATTMNLITTEQWNSAVTTGKYRFRMTLVDETSTFTSLVVDYLNEVE